MCTLTLAWQVFEDAPVAVAANRDEALEREALPPDIYREEPSIVAPQDVEAGGTWIGYNEHGVFVGITNRWTDADLAAERSRGLLVADVLEAETAFEAESIVEDAVRTDEYDGFYLVLADASSACCYRWDGTLSYTAFDPGVHVVVNVAVDETVDIPAVRPDAAREQAANARAVREALSSPNDESAADWLERAAGVLGDHEYGVCVHGNGYGTRSSSLIAIGAGPTRHAFASGPPCRTPFEPVVLEAAGSAETVGIDGDRDVEGHI
ncbi:NRDE family protein [Natronorubrum sp. DTA28]|uniref:NRDE family protein n=1 Tax=Natronorubrum sp. DTA28 TaxID=3447019 RepID=UPI003F82BB2B